MHYSSGFFSLVSFAGAALWPQEGPLAAWARGLLEASGALFGLYLVAWVGLTLAGAVLRRRRPHTVDLTSVRVLGDGRGQVRGDVPDPLWPTGI